VSTTTTATKTTDTSSKPLTRTAAEWDSYWERNSVDPDEVTGAARDCMSRLDQPRETASPISIDLSPWLQGEKPIVRGAMWAGVPFVEKAWKEKDGSWMIETLANAKREGLYLRLIPAEEDAKVQYGMCRVLMDKFLSRFQERLGPRSGWKIKAVAVGTHHGAPFRIDKILASAMKLSSPKNRSGAGRKFKTLLGVHSLETFTENLTGQCYADSSAKKNILIHKDEAFTEMVGLVVLQAYPKLLSPTLETGLDSLNSALGLDGVGTLRACTVWPKVYNVLMPQEIFYWVDHCLEKGIAPLVPTYVTTTSWMFNGRWAEPCGGLYFAPGVPNTPHGTKILAGVLNCFNLDLQGCPSFWDPGYECPDRGWVDTFLRVSRELTEFQMGWDSSCNRDRSLLFARKVPVLLDTIEPGTGEQVRYVRLTHIGADVDGWITRLETCECDNTGKEPCEESPELPISPELPESQEPIVPDLRDSVGRTTECEICEISSALGYTSTCLECGAVGCWDCFNFVCEECGREELCANCVSHHVCEAEAGRSI